MSHKIVLQAYEHSIQAPEHCLPYNVPLCEDPEGSKKIYKIIGKLQQLENSCAEVTNGYKKISAVIHNREDEQFHKKVEKEKENHEKQKDKKML